MPREASKPLTDFGQFVKDRISDLVDRGEFKSQSDMCRKHDIVPQTLNRWLRDDHEEPKRPDFEKLAVALGVPYDVLYRKKEESRALAGISAKPSRPTIEPRLSQEQISALLDQRHVGYETRDAWSRLYAELGAFHKTTQTYVLKAISVLDRELSSGKTEEAAIEAARREAKAAALEAEAEATGVRRSQSQVYAPPAEPPRPTSQAPSTPPPPAPTRRKSGSHR